MIDTDRSVDLAAKDETISTDPKIWRQERIDIDARGQPRCPWYRGADGFALLAKEKKEIGMQGVKPQGSAERRSAKEVGQQVLLDHCCHCRW